MFQKLIQQFNVFSRENWWIYLLLLGTILIVLMTWKGNLLEIIILFSINLLWAMSNMLMMSSYKNKNFSEGSVFILIANILYTSLSIYAWIHDGDMQYIFWQLSFLLAGIKVFMLYNFARNLSLINMKSIFVLNIIVLSVLVFYIWITPPVFVQSLWIFAITLGLAITHDIYRYFLIVFGNFFIVAGSMLLLWENYLDGNILWVTVAYMLLWLSTLVYYLKLFPLYISRFKKL
jgi:hypothetical protein